MGSLAYGGLVGFLNVLPTRHHQGNVNSANTPPRAVAVLPPFHCAWPSPPGLDFSRHVLSECDCYDRDGKKKTGRANTRRYTHPIEQFAHSLTGLISVASMLPWRRDTVSSERSTSNLTTPEAAAPTKTGAGSAAAAQAAVIDGNNAGAAKRRGRGAAGDVDAASGGGTVVRSFSRSTAARRRTATAVPPHMQEESSSSGGERKSFSSSSSTAAAAASAAAARLPDPSRHNEGAPAWMRSDLAVDRVRVD